MEDEFFLDQGAYVRTHGARVPEMTMAMLPGPYRIPAYRVTGHFRLTNKTPAATYRAPGRYEGSFVRERLMDAVADRLGLDPDRGAPAQSDQRRRDAVHPVAQRVGHRDRLRFGRLRAAARQGAGAYRLGTVAGANCGGAAMPGELVGAGIGIFVDKGGLGPADGTRISVDTPAPSSW